VATLARLGILSEVGQVGLKLTRFATVAHVVTGRRGEFGLDALGLTNMEPSLPQCSGAIQWAQGVLLAHQAD
jgi:hypothetical protein